MIDSVVFIKRQSPDWQALARDYRAARPIDPARFVPDHLVPGFPADIAALVAAWNRRFPIDFFTVRSVIAALSERSTRAATHCVSLPLAAVAHRAATHHFMAFFHDDDDLFAPAIASLLQATDALDYDTCVFPLYRIHADLFTFVPAATVPDLVLGRSAPFDFRFQSNNYGINSRLCSEPTLCGMKDHVLASAFAEAAGYSVRAFPFAVSATVKTPASASQLPGLFSSEAALRAQFDGFIEQCRRSELDAAGRWLTRPLQAIARLLQAVIAGADYSAIDDLLADQR